MTILDAIEVILTEEGRPLHYTDIATRLMKQGQGLSRAKDIPASVRGCMLKDIATKSNATRFFRSGNGVYGLSTWGARGGGGRMTTGRDGASRSVVSEERTPLFTEETFDLLAGLHADPMASFYQQHKDAFKSSLEQPFQHLFRAVAARLPAPITSVMETNHNVFARIYKNDYGKKGAWDFYWGAFYPKGRKRTEAPQLFVSIHHERLEFGFYIGRYGTEDRRRFLHNSTAHKEDLQRLLHVGLPQDAPLTHGTRISQGESIDSSVQQPVRSLAEWLDQARTDEARATVMIPQGEVVWLTIDDLATKIARTFERLFPFILLATEDEPTGAIRAYLGHEEKEEEEPAPPAHPVNPPYTLEACAEDTGISVEELGHWVRAIERKGQAILYGPPGTGKTFMAEHLARHLVGGGDGFVELVQFHPAYTYEDFVQGLRPIGRPDGSLDYALIDGRFLSFCDAAQRRTDRCVLIIDEINRADLARVFGELMYLLEYRDRTIPLASGRALAIPSNVRIIGAMNTADRSIALVDHALRRRFAFLELRPRLDILRSYHARTGFRVDGLVHTLERVNGQIDDPHYAVGISYFLRDDLDTQIEDIWRTEIEPYLAEFFFDQPATVISYRWEKVGATIRP
jgi:5-methylcytosine-specific restriction protein B